MSEEEKAEKYLIRFWQKNNIVDILPIKTAWDLRCLLIDVIKYVLAEGRKEICKKILEEIRTHEGIEQMTKFYIGEIIKDLEVDL